MTALPRNPRIAQRGLPTALAVGDPQTVSAVPQTVNLLIYKGDDFWLDLIVTNPDGSDADLSTAVASAQIRSAPNSEDLMAAFTASIEDNIIHLHLAHGQADNLIAGQCAWDAQINTASVITTLVAGAVIVSGEVTMP